MSNLPLYALVFSSLMTGINPATGAEHDRIVEPVCICQTKQGGFFTKTIDQAIRTREGKALLTAVCTSFTANPASCTATIETAGKIYSETTQQGPVERRGEIRPRPGYQMCKAWLASNGWNATSDTDGSLTMDPDGLLWYIAIGGDASAGRWLKWTVFVEQVRSRGSECYPDGRVIFRTNDKTASPWYEEAYKPAPIEIVNRMNCLNIC